MAARSAQQRHAGEVLQHDAGDHEGISSVRSAPGPAGQPAHVGLGDAPAVEVAQQVRARCAATPAGAGAESRRRPGGQRMEAAAAAGGEEEAVQGMKGLADMAFSW
jgi:hypothetical protein